MEPKPEPWWPLKWIPWMGLHSGYEMATLKGHPIIEQVERTNIPPLNNARFLRHACIQGSRMRALTEWYPGMDDLTIRAMLLSFAYPEGKDET